jgi:hypothetical protein
MLTLATHQSATWGYSVKNYPLPNTTGGGGNLPTFTKPVMAFNGNMYCVSVAGGGNHPVINGVAEPRVILKITPGTTNTKTTDYSPATFTYIFPDFALSPNAAGFARPVWPIADTNAAVQFNRGILASNGLIYWSPIDNSNFLIFDPTTELWKTSNIHPDRVDATTSLAFKIHSCVLGRDGKIYVIPNLGHKLYRIATSVGATNDIVEQGYWTTGSDSANMGIGNTSMTYYDNNGVLQTDTALNANGGTITRAYDKQGGNSAQRTLPHIADVIVHPNGKIYLIPFNGRGRIFYINTDANWSTTKQVVSSAGLTIATASGVNKVPRFSYAFLEKPRNAQHDPNTLKIYLMPGCQSVAGTPNLYSQFNYEMMYINPTTDTLHEIPMNFTYSVSANQYQVGTKILLANGLNITVNLADGSGNNGGLHGGAVLTGIDVPATDPDGAITIKKDLTRTGLGTIPGILSGQTGVGLLYSPEPGFVINAKSGLNIPFPHHSKYILNTGGNLAIGSIAEVVSVKQYGIGPNEETITNFTFADRDRQMYELPAAGPSSLAASLYNSNFNR